MVCSISLFPFSLSVVAILEAENILLLTVNSSGFIYVDKVIFFPPSSCRVSSKAGSFFFKDKLLHNCSHSLLFVDGATFFDTVHDDLFMKVDLALWVAQINCFLVPALFYIKLQILLVLVSTVFI